MVLAGGLKTFFGVGLLLGQRLKNACINLVVGCAYRWAQPGQEQFGLHRHLGDTGPDNTRRQTAPTCMDRSHQGAIHIGDQNRQAIGSQHRAANTGLVGPRSIGLQVVVNTWQAQTSCPVYLA